MSAQSNSSRELLPRAIRELNTTMKVISFYPRQHPSVRVALDRLLSTLHGVLAQDPEVDLAFGEAGILHQGEYLTDSDQGLQSFSNFLMDRGVARLVFRHGIDGDTLADFLRLLASDPTRIAEAGGLSHYLATRRIDTIRLGEIDLEKILASEADSLHPGVEVPGGEKEAWKRLVTDFLRDPTISSGDGLKTLFRNLASDGQSLSKLVVHLSEESPRELPRLLGRLADVLRTEAPELKDRSTEALGEAIMKMEPRIRMALMLNRIPLADGAADLMEPVIQKMSDPVIVDLVSSFVEAEQQLSPRLFSVCSKVFAARGKSAPYFGPVTACLQRADKKGNADLGRIWQSLQGLLVESDHDYLSETYRATLDAISIRAGSVDTDLRAALASAPGFREAFGVERITDHACRVIIGALDVASDESRIEPLRDDLQRRSRKMTGRERLPLLGEVVRALADPRPGDIDTPGRAAMDKRVRAAAEQMVQTLCSEFERLTEEEKTAANQSFQEVKGIVAPILLDSLAQEENWEVRKGLLSILTSLGRAAVPAILRRLNDPSWFLVRNAVLLLGQIGGPNLVDPLAALLRHEEPRVRREAAAALGKIGGPRAVAHLRTAILDVEVSAVAARVLGEIDRDNTIALFSRRLEKTGLLLINEGPVREAITVLGEMEAPEGVAALSRILNRGFWIPFATGDAVRAEAAQALRRIGTLEAIAAIQKATRSTRRLVRDTCQSLTAAGLPDSGRDVTAGSPVPR